MSNIFEQPTQKLLKTVKMLGYFTDIAFGVPRSQYLKNLFRIPNDGNRRKTILWPQA